jgi:hypothetical protein
MVDIAVTGSADLVEPLDPVDRGADRRGVESALLLDGLHDPDVDPG